MPDRTDTKAIGSLFIELQSVDSTNNYARKLIESAGEHGTAIFACEQTKGRGQQGRTWSSQPNMNLALSIILVPPAEFIQLPFYLSAIVALSAHQFFMKYAGDETRNKWPNDIYWKDRKAGGILIEIVHAKAIAGIGININQATFPADLPNPVSLKQITGKDHDPLVLAKELCEITDKNYQALLKGDFEKIFKDYNKNLYGLGKTLKFKKDNRQFEGSIKGVSTSGKLIVQHTMEEEFDTISYLSIK